jgi:guanine deaminase
MTAMQAITDEGAIREAIQLARQSVQENLGGPFGAIILKAGAVVGRGWNQVTTANDPTAHAEVVAIREACRALNTFHLEGCSIYASCEPCPMCLAAIFWARIDRIFFSATRHDAAQAGFDDELFYIELNRPLDQRQVKAVQLCREEALQVFHEWREKPNKVPY